MPNFSDRFTAIVSGTKPDRGNTPTAVCESIRKKGLVKEEVLPMNKADTLDEFYSPNPMTEKYLKMGKKFLSEFEFRHEWVWRTENTQLKEKQIRLKLALKQSPVGVSVYAWVKDGEYYIKDTFAKDNHWTVCYGYEEGKYWKIFDSYDNTHKKLAWNYPFGFAKRFYIQRLNQPRKIWWKAFLEWFADLFN